MKKGMFYISIAALGIVLSSCDGHMHTFDSNWSYTEEGHYHIATCEHSDLHTDIEPHEFEVTTVAPTYESAGYKRHTCTVCGYHYDDEPTDKLVHHYSEQWTSGGAEGHYHLCLDAGYTTLHTDYVPHNYTVRTVAPTFSEPGYDRHTCSDCGYYYDDNEVAKKEHTYATYWSYDDNGHYHACLDSGYYDLRADEEPHDFQVVTHAPTYTLQGYDQYSCSKCNWAQKRNYVPRLEHHYDETTWVTDNTYHWHACVDEGYATLTKDKATHSGDTWIVDTNPTMYEEGRRHKVCSVCGVSFAEESIPCLLETESVDVLSYNNSAPIAASAANMKLSRAKVASTAIDYNGKVQPVTKISDKGFKNCTYLEELIIPTSVTTIGSNAFENCYNLKSITIPSSITSIGADAFKNCTALAEIVNLSSLSIVPGSTANGGIGLYAKSVITNPEDSKLHVSDGVVYIQDGAQKHFCGIDMLATSVVIDNSYTSFNHKAFAGHTNLRNIEISFPITEVVSAEFVNLDSLESITLPETVTKIGSSAFRYDYKLKQANIPDAVTEIGEYAFSGTDLSSIYLSDNVTSLGFGTFGSMYSLKEARLPSGLTYIEGALFYDCYNLEHIDIPEGVTVIGSNAFLNCRSLKSITLPAAFQNAKDGAFSDCYRLKQIINKSSVTINYSYQRDRSYLGGLCYYMDYYTDDETKSKIHYRDDGFVTFNQEYYLLDYVGTDTTVEIPSDIESYYEYALADREIYSLTVHRYLPRNLTYNNKKLIQLVLGTGYTGCDYGPIDNTSLGEIVNLSGKSVDSSLKTNCINLVTSMDDATATLDDYLTVTGGGRCVLYGYRGDSTVLNIPEGVTEIYGVWLNNMGYGAFQGDRQIKIVNTPSTLTKIGQYAFNGSYVEGLYASEGLTLIEQYAFDRCYKLIEVELPNSVLDVQYCSFQYCINLTHLTLGNQVNIGNQAFYGTGNYVNYSLETLIIPEGVSTIEVYGLYGNKALKTVYLPSTITSVGNNALNALNQNVTIYYNGDITSYKAISKGNACGLPATLTSSSSVALYSENKPTNTSYRYWHYDTDGRMTLWA